LSDLVQTHPFLLEHQEALEALEGEEDMEDLQLLDY